MAVCDSRTRNVAYFWAGLNLGWGSYRVQTMHTRQASKFALYRAQTQNMGKYRGKGLALVTSEIWASQRYILLIRRQCIGYLASVVPYTLPYIGP